MGITIHYRGKLDDRARFAEMIDAARLYCAEQRWHALEVDERIIGHVERIVETHETPIEIEGVQGAEVESFTQAFPIDDTMRGLIINAHRKSEPMWLTFNEAGEMVHYMALNDVGEYWESKTLFTKTHFAGVETHIAVCEFLHWLQDNYMPGLTVYDEGGYFESGDEQKLAYAFGFLNGIMDRLQNALENPDSDDPEAQAMRGVIEAKLEESGEPKPKRKKLKVERGKAITKPDPQWKRGRGISANKN